MKIRYTVKIEGNHTMVYRSNDGKSLDYGQGFDKEAARRDAKVQPDHVWG